MPETIDSTTRIDIVCSQIDPCEEATLAIGTLEESTTDIGRRLGDAQHFRRLVAAASDVIVIVVELGQTGSGGRSSDSGGRIADLGVGPLKEIAVVEMLGALVDEPVGAAIESATEIGTRPRHGEHKRGTIALALGTVGGRLAGRVARQLICPDQKRQ